MKVISEHCGLQMDWTSKILGGIGQCVGKRALVTYIQLFVCVKVSLKRKFQIVYVMAFVHECHPSANFKKEVTLANLYFITEKPRKQGFDSNT